MVKTKKIKERWQIENLINLIKEDEQIAIPLQKSNVAIFKCYEGEIYFWIRDQEGDFMEEVIVFKITDPGEYFWRIRKRLNKYIFKGKPMKDTDLVNGKVLKLLKGRAPFMA